MLELVEMKQDLKLLDVGGGTGRAAVLFAGLTRNLVVADAAFNMLRKSKGKGIPSVQSQSEHIPFKDGAFDRIIMVDALHHVADQQQTINEMRRLLAPKGKMVIEEPDIHNFVVKLIALGEKLLLMRSHFLSPVEIAAMSNHEPVNSVEVHRENGVAWIIITNENLEPIRSQ